MVTRGPACGWRAFSGATATQAPTRGSGVSYGTVERGVLWRRKLRRGASGRPQRAQAWVRRLGLQLRPVAWRTRPAPAHSSQASLSLCVLACAVGPEARRARRRRRRGGTVRGLTVDEHQKLCCSLEERMRQPCCCTFRSHRLLPVAAVAVTVVPARGSSKCSGIVGPLRLLLVLANCSLQRCALGRLT